MRLACGVALVLALLVAQASPQSGAPTGSIEFAARAAPSAGRAEPVRDFPFHLLRKSFSVIQKEAEESEPRPNLDEFVEGLEVTKELKAWMKRTHTAQLSGAEFLRRVTVNDVFSVPEFFDAYLAQNSGDVGFPQPKYREQDRERKPQKYERQRQEYREQMRKFLEANLHSLQGMDLFLAPLDPGQRWAKQEADRQRRVRLRALELAQTRYLVARVETDLDGRAALHGIPPGRYWLSSLEAEAAAGDVRLRWDVPVEVRAAQTTRLELSNVNAVQPARPSR